MDINLPETVINDITEFSEKHNIKKVILFGSRARKSNSERSDVDIAVCGGNYLGFYNDINENAHTLLMFDIIDLDKNISVELQNEIERDGIIIYEKN